LTKKTILPLLLATTVATTSCINYPLQNGVPTKEKQTVQPAPSATQLPTASPSPTPIINRFLPTEPDGEPAVHLRSDLSGLPVSVKNKFDQSLSALDLSETEIQTYLLEFQHGDSSPRKCLLFGKKSAEHPGQIDKLWLYVGANKEKEALVPLTDNTEGIILPLARISEPETEQAGTAGDNLIFNIDLPEGPPKSDHPEFLRIDLNQFKVHVTDPWTSITHPLQAEPGRKLLAWLAPPRQELVPNLPSEQTRFALKQGWLPVTNGEGGWWAVNGNEEIVRVWSQEALDWVSPRIRTTPKTLHNIEAWLNWDSFDYSRDDLFRDPYNMDIRFPIGHFTKISLRSPHELKKSATIVQVQGILLGFGTQENSLEYEEENLTYYTKLIFLGLTNQTTGKRIVYPFTFGVVDPNPDDLYGFGRDQYHIYWHAPGAPIWGEMTVYAQEFHVDEVPEILSFMMRKPISVIYQIDVYEDDVSLDAYIELAPAERRPSTDEEYAQAEFNYDFWMNTFNNDWALLWWMENRNGKAGLTKPLDLNKTYDSLFPHKILAPELVEK
jgi:hypothetical protein